MRDMVRVKYASDTSSAYMQLFARCRSMNQDGLRYCINLINVLQSLIDWIAKPPKCFVDIRKRLMTNRKDDYLYFKECGHEKKSYSH